MKTAKLEFNYEVYNSSKELNTADAALLNAARKATKNSFARYSNFNVGAAAKLKDEKEIMIGSNQENASYPVSICAERGLMAAVAGKFGKKVIETMAISYVNKNKGKKSSEPISPCGMCRQALVQYEENTKHPIRLILSGKSGKVYVIAEAKHLLPLQFDGTKL
ncbi:MAG: cytidine deaminase [Bacteroidetes bacterium]|nr:MAG: cytidine deaminase [Bacteroidota bacterium]